MKAPNMQLSATYLLLTILSIISVRAKIEPRQAAQNGTFMVEATSVVMGGKVYTMDSMFHTYDDGAVAICNGTIVWVGEAPELDVNVNMQNATIVDAQGHPIMPGLIDSHMHPLLAGIAALSCSLDAESLTASELHDKIQACLDADPTSTDDDILTVVAWDRPGFFTANGRDATYKDLEGISSRPIQLKATDGHSTLVNGKLLQRLNVTAATPDPPGGHYERDGSGQPNGLLEDSAGYEVLNIVDPSIEVLTTAASIAQSIVNAHGITSLVDAAVTTKLQVPAYSALHDAGHLTTRYFGSFVIFDPDLQGLESLLANFTQIRGAHETGPMTAAAGINLGAIKYYMDGIITYPTSSGAMLEPYNVPDPNNASNWVPGNTTIKPYNSGSNLTQFLDLVMNKGFNAHVHADGDASVRALLDSVEALPYPLEDNRVAAAHAEQCDPSDYPRFAELNVRLIMQYQWAQDSNFYHAVNGTGDTNHALGPMRMEHLQPYGNLTNIGNNVMYGSDWPVEPLDPFLALQIGVTRKGSLTNENSPASQNPMYYDRFDTQATLSRVSAMRGLTTYGAEWAHATSQIGSLEVGKFADLIVTQNDYFDPLIPDSTIADNAVLMTMVGGEVVYTADSASGNSTGLVGRANDGLHVPRGIWSEKARRQQQAWRKRDPERNLMGLGGIPGGCGGHLHKHAH